MNAWLFVRSLLVAVFFLATSAVTACGADVASCDSVCGPSVVTQPDFGVTSNGFGSCSAVCASQEDTCATKGEGSEFQAYLTCIGNAGGLLAGSAEVDAPLHFGGESVPPPCLAEEEAVARLCGL